MTKKFENLGIAALQEQLTAAPRAVSSGDVIAAFLGGFWIVWRDGHTCGLKIFCCCRCKTINWITFREDNF